MINIITIRKTYEKQEIVEIKWINKESNSTNTITKSKPYQALKNLINNNTIKIKITEQIEKDQWYR